MSTEDNAHNDFQSTFLRAPSLEEFFAAILAKPILKTTVITGKKSETIETDDTLYREKTLQYFYDRGYYPLCIDELNAKLVILLNREFEFPPHPFAEDGEKGEKFESDEEIAGAMQEVFDSYEPQFYSTFLPEALKNIVKSVYNIEFRVVNAKDFESVFKYVCAPHEIKEYERKRKIADRKATGVIGESEEYESAAAEILDAILTFAVLNRATDVHFEWTGVRYVARIRVDGDLRLYPQEIPSEYYAALINVIRTRADIDIAQRFQPQDGYMTFEANFVGGEMTNKYDIRISIIPEVEERLQAVLRIQRSKEFKGLGELGFTKEVEEDVFNLCAEPHGLVLVTGPTGSGKTTTLYSMLKKINRPDIKILTAEDPVEIRMNGITQVAINDQQQRSFEKMLRAFLRHDPDVILVGEIRDVQTARLATEAANTGHLVLSTLHTNDAPSAIKRLINMEGFDSADFSFAIKAVMAQRLIKTFSPSIRKNYLALKDSKDELEEFMFSQGMRYVDGGLLLNEYWDQEIFQPETFRLLDGPSTCFEGRTAITEYWRIGHEAQDMIFAEKFSTRALSKVAIEKDHMIPMSATGLEKVINLETSMDSLVKVVGLESMKHNKEVMLQRYFEG